MELSLVNPKFKGLDSAEYYLGLPQLLGARTVSEFLSHVWERCPLLSRGAVGAAVSDILTIDQFETLMASANSGSLSIVEDRLARPMSEEGCVRSGQSILDSYRRGCTLLQSGVQLRWPPIYKICREIENQLLSNGVLLSEAVSGNAYLTPRSAQGFDIHYDNHCAIIVQLHGRKQWTVFPALEELPVDRCEKPISRDQLQPPILEANLESGDVLYIPRGLPHYAVTSAHSSLHLTLSLRTTTWIEVLEAISRSNPLLRRSVPPEGCRDEFPQHFVRQQLTDAITRMDLAGFVDRRLSATLAKLGPRSGGRLRAMDQAGELDRETPVRRTPQAICRVTDDDGQVLLSFPGASLRLPMAMKSVFEFIADNEEMTASQLPKIDAEYDALQLIRILINRGLLQPVLTEGK